MLWKNPFAASERGQQQGSQGNQNSNANNGNVGGSGNGQQLPNTNQQRQQQSRSFTDPGNNSGGGQNGNDGNNGDDGRDPLLEFDSLWQPNVGEDGKPVKQEDNSSKPYLPQIDQKAFGAMIDRLDFTRSLDDNDMAAIAAGGEGASKALKNILNKTSRQSFATAFQAITKMVESGFQGASGRFSESIPNHVREIMVDDRLYDSNPIIKNPAFAPLVKGIRAQYTAKFPKAGPGEVDAAVNAYFNKMAEELTTAGKKKNGGNELKLTNKDKLSKGSADADFAEWLGVGLGNDAGGNSDPDGMNF